MNSWKVWAKGLLASLIGGAATVLSGYSAGADWHVIGRMAVTAAVGAAGLYLKKSPIADVSE